MAASERSLLEKSQRDREQRVANLIQNKDRSWLWRTHNQCRLLALPTDFFFSPDLTAIWRRHLVWSKKDGGVLLEIVTSRFATTNIFLSLLFSAEVGTYFSPSDIVTSVRQSLQQDQPEDIVQFAAGVVLLLSIISTGSAILANYIALGVLKTLSHRNASIILRSNIGLYAAQLPSRLTFVSVYLFFGFLLLFWWTHIQKPAVVLLTVVTVLTLTHVVSTFSTLGHIIMGSSAMGEAPIVPLEDEIRMTPTQLSNILTAEGQLHRLVGTKVNRQYEANTQDQQEQLQTYIESLKIRHPELAMNADLEETLE